MAMQEIRTVAGLDTWRDELDSVIEEAREALKARQSSEYIMLRHFLGEVDDDASIETEAKIGRYLRARQNSDGGWPLFHGGDSDLSVTIKAYLALKLAGDDPEAAHMRRARAAVLRRGGAANANVFTRFSLALFGLIPWRAVPNIPVEIMLLPRPSPFHLEKVSYWSRTVIVPLLILAALKPRAQNPRGVRVDELFLNHPDEERYSLGALEPHFPWGARQRAIQRAIDFIVPRLNGEDGLGGIFPAMANAVMAFEALGFARDHLYADAGARDYRRRG
jgi:squalene-hopene/tetraprenyl-beta-curcumene cyclase